MPTVDWASSGTGISNISLQDAQQLAVDAGFTYVGDHAGLPLARRANLQAMFEHFDVTPACLSAFRQLFSTHHLHPGGNGSKGTAIPRSASDSSNSLWQVQQQGEKVYVGELLNGKRHGMGILFSKGARSYTLYAGQFAEGKRSGLGLAATSHGERLAVAWHEDVPWGPGIYTYAPPGSGQGDSDEDRAGAARWRVQFQGILNGRPQGKGCMIWSDAQEEMGRFDGNECCERLEEDEIEGVITLAIDNANSAGAMAESAQAMALQQQQQVAEQARELLDRVALFPHKHN